MPIGQRGSYSRRAWTGRIRIAASAWRAVAAEKQGGGIGLAMVRHLVHENGGTVRYARTAGAGARFIISF